MDLSIANSALEQPVILLLSFGLIWRISAVDYQSLSSASERSVSSADALAYASCKRIVLACFYLLSWLYL